MAKFVRHSPILKFQSGLSLVELLVSLVIGMAVIAGSIQVVVNSKREFMDQNEVQFIQSNSRYALDVISKDLRMAGYLGCVTTDTAQIANTINDSENGFISMHGLRGFEGEDNKDSFPSDYKTSANLGTDSFIVRHASTGGEMNVKSHNSASAVITLWDAHTYPVGSTLVITDASCRSIGLFQVSGTGAGSKEIVHDTDDAVATVANNCTKILKGNFDCGSPSCAQSSCNGFNKNTGEYGAGSRVMEFVSHAYYVAPSDLVPGMSALKRYALQANGEAVTASEEVALGVEDFEITYGVDTDADGNVDQFRAADAMDLDSSGSASDEEWNRVLSVKISLVFRSRNPVLPMAESKTLAGITYNDRYLRQLVNSTIRIRNRG